MKYIVRFFAALGVLFFIGIVLGVISFFGIVNRAVAPPALPDRAFLYQSFTGELSATPGNDPLASLLGEKGIGLQDAIAALERAREDDRITGFVAHFGPVSLPMADAQEFRDAVLRFRDAGKFAYFFTDSFGELTPAMGLYLAATAFDEIWVQPAGYVGLHGFASEQLYFADALSEIGVSADFARRKDYKTAVEGLIRSEMSVAEREQTESRLRDLQAQFDTAVREARGVDQAMIEEAMAAAPLPGERAVAFGLIDQNAYLDELLTAIRERDPEAEAVDFARYRAGPPPWLAEMQQRQTSAGGEDEARALAIVTGKGIIMRGFSQETLPFGGPEFMAGDAVAEAIIDAAEDPSIAAIVFRVDSPGGSAIGSETVRRAVQRARAEFNKPVVVSMGSVAASGGYWVSMDADVILAQPATLTGSIGVYGGKLVFGDLLTENEVNREVVSTAPNATFLSPFAPFSESQSAALNTAMDDIYDRFIRSVSSARDLPVERVDALAGGRIWTGRQAFELGLVDRLGGLRDAYMAAKELAGIPLEEKVPVRRFPAPRSPLDQLRDVLGAPLGMVGLSPHEAALLTVLREAFAVIMPQRSVQMAPVTPP